MSGKYFEAESHITTYNKFRPTPPKAMIEEIVRFTSEKFSGPFELAVDVGCGSGQSTEVFAPYFKKVLGIDSSLSIVQEARIKCRHPNVAYSQGTAENVPVDDESATMVSVCQALHWFDVAKFYEEANRILRKGGVLAVYGYNLPVPVVENADEGISAIVRKYYEDILGAFVHPESRKAYLESYASNEFNDVAFVEGGKMARTRDYVSEIEGTLCDLTGYISSWSTYQNYVKQMGEEKGREILKNFESDFKGLVRNEINPSETFTIKYNYFLLLGRKSQ